MVSPEKPSFGFTRFILRFELKFDASSFDFDALSFDFEALSLDFDALSIQFHSF
jgi:hypothetical protein